MTCDKCSFRKDGLCGDPEEFVNEHGAPVCRYRDDAIPIEVWRKAKIEEAIHAGRASMKREIMEKVENLSSEYMDDCCSKLLEIALAAIDKVKE